MNRIRELREAKNMQQKELAIELKVSQPTISDWESERKQPSSKSAARIADYFSVSIDFLLGREIPNEIKKDPTTNSDEIVTEEDRMYLKKYRNAPADIKRVVDRILEDE